MAWTAVDIRNQRFRLRWRGFDPEEVVLFLNVVADEVERLTQTIRQLEHDNRVLQEQLEEYRERERHIRNTLVAAQQSADRIRQQAQQEAELIVREAEFWRDQVLITAQTPPTHLASCVLHLVSCIEQRTFGWVGSLPWGTFDEAGRDDLCLRLGHRVEPVCPMG